MKPANNQGEIKRAPIPGGYYLKARKIQYPEIACKPPHVREICDWLLMKANHKDVQLDGTLIRRGQLLTSYDELRTSLAVIWFFSYGLSQYRYIWNREAVEGYRIVPSGPEGFSRSGFRRKDDTEPRPKTNISITEVMMKKNL
jgi:hypothetical protein